MKTIYTRVLVCLMTLSAAINIKAQTLNSMTEVIPFKMTDGKIIIAATVNGEPADFVLDLAGHTALLPEAVKKLRIDTSKPGSFSAYQDFQFKKVATGEIYNIGTLTIGNNIFANDLPAFILKDEPYLRKLGVMGVINCSAFRLYRYVPCI